MSTLASSLLIAAPSLHCPFFNHTVVLMVEHDAEGAFGFVVNRPTETSLAALVTRLKITPEADLARDVWLGGPVAPETGWVIFDPTSGDTAVDSVCLDPTVAITASRDLLEELAAARGPERFLVLLGYAGWGPGQLDNEIREGSWVQVDLDAGILFDLPADKRWNAAWEQLGIDPARMLSPTVAEA